jgi:polyphosphate kinase
MKNSKLRVYQLASELNLSSKEILQLCQDLKLSAKTPTSSLAPEEVNQVRRQCNEPQAEKPLSEEMTETPLEPKSIIPKSLYSSQYYFNRELSWLRFNERVLHEAFDPRNPLLERLKFMAIFSTNLDEYFMVRISGLKQQVAAHVTKRTPDGMMPQEQLDAIHNELKPTVIRQHQYFSQTLKSLLTEAGIRLLDYDDLSDQQVESLQTYFLEQLFPVLTPLAVDPGHPFPYISSLSLNLAVVVKDRESGEEHFARVKVPDQLPRFVALPIPKSDTETLRWWGVPLEQVITHNLYKLFPGMEIQTCHPFRITRNADFELEEDEADDLLLAIEQEIRKRRFGSVMRMEIQVGTPPELQRTLMEEMDLIDQDVYAVEGLLSLCDLFALSSLPFPELKDPPWTPVVPPRFKKLAALPVPRR